MIVHVSVNEYTHAMDLENFFILLPALIRIQELSSYSMVMDIDRLPKRVSITATDTQHLTDILTFIGSYTSCLQ